MGYSDKEFKVIGWDKNMALPQVPERLAMYIVKDGLKYTIYITDARGNYMSQNPYASEPTFDNDIVVSLGVGENFGKYKNGDTIPSTGLTSRDVIIMANTSTLTPTFVAPYMTLTLNNMGTKEVGEEITLIQTIDFNRGQIKGVLTGGVWNAGGFQDYRSGEVDHYVFNGSNSNLGTKTTNYSVNLGNNTFSASTYYLEGPQPKASDGEDYGSPLTAGSVSDSKTFQGAYKIFFGPNSGSVPARGLSSWAYANQDTSTSMDLVTGTVANKFEIYVPQGLVLDTVVLVEASNADIKSQYVKTAVTVDDAGGNPRTYSKYTMITDIPYTTSVTHRFKLKEE